MINNIWFKIIAGKINRIPELYTIFARKMPDYIIWTRSRPSQSQNLEAEAEAKASRPRPRPKLWPRGHFGLEDLTSLFLTDVSKALQPTEIRWDTLLFVKVTKLVCVTDEKVFLYKSAENNHNKRMKSRVTFSFLLYLSTQSLLHASRCLDCVSWVSRCSAASQRTVAQRTYSALL